MFFDTRPTAYDLRFRAFRIPVRVNPFFWLAMAFLGQAEFLRGFDYGLLWVVCGFVSILTHELGHAAVGRYFRSPVGIVLLPFGGLAILSYPPASAWRRLAFALGGPAAGFILLAAVWGSNELVPWYAPGRALRPGYANAVFLNLVFINLVWTLLNLLPIWPFDGGKVLREVLVLLRRRRPDVTTQRVSLVVAGGLAAYGILTNLNVGVPGPVADLIPWWAKPGVMGTVFFVILAVQSYMELQKHGRGPRLFVDDDDSRPWRRRA